MSEPTRPLVRVLTIGPEGAHTFYTPPGGSGTLVAAVYPPGTRLPEAVLPVLIAQHQARAHVDPLPPGWVRHLIEEYGGSWPLEGEMA